MKLEKMPTFPSQQRNEKIIQLARQGMSYQEIADLFELSRGRVSQICIAAGVVRRPLDVNPANIKNLEVKKALEEIRGRGNRKR